MKKILTVFLLTIFIVSALPCVSAGFAVNGETSGSVVKVEQWTRRKPDLTLTSNDIVFSQASPTEGETVTITATIRNIGTAYAWSVEVGFYDGASPIGIKKTGYIKAGGTGTASIGWKATPAGNHIIRVVADPNKKISESNENNNEASKTITVSGVGVLIPDLTLTPADIAFTPEAPVEGDTVTITATIHNEGNGTASNVVVDFYLNETISLGTDTISNIAAGRTGTASVTWDAVLGNYSIDVVADPSDAIDESEETNNQASSPITVSEAPPAPPYDYELFIEIDYIGSHEPTQEVLAYIHGYYYERRINVAFYVENVTAAVINLGITYEDGVNDNEFWAIEAAVNNLGGDAYGTGDPVFGTAGVYSSKWKWVLFGTTVENNPNVVGYCYIVRQKIGLYQWDLLAGNYIFIADETADDWATSPKLEIGAEAVVLMHEMGHSIGICILDSRGGEVYCSNPECVMSYLSVNNAGNYLAWFYCDNHWATRNMGYYKIP